MQLHLVASAAYPAAVPPSSEVAQRVLRSPLDARVPQLAKVWFEQVAFGSELRRSRLNVGHVPYFAPPLTAGIPIVVTVHDLVPIINAEYRESVAERLYFSLVRAGLRSATLVIADSAASARDLADKARVHLSRIRVIPLGVDKRFHPFGDAQERARAESLRRTCGVTDPFLLCVTGFDRRKNVMRLIQAFARLRENPVIHHDLVIVGALRPGRRFLL